VVDSHFMYVAGGCIANQTIFGNCPTITASVERYDFIANTWSSLPALPRARFRYAANAINGKIYYMLGRIAVDTIWQWGTDVFDIAAGTFTTLPQQTDLYVQRSDCASFAIGSQIYIVGGYSADYSVAYNSTIVWDTSDGTNKFRAGVVADFPAQTGNGDNGAVTIGGKGYVFGGFTCCTYCAPVNWLHVYDPVMNRWSVLASMNEARGAMAYATWSGLVFAMGGQEVVNCSLNVPVKTVEVYFPSNNTWVFIAPISHDHFRFRGAAFNNSVFEVGGQEDVVMLTPYANSYWPIDNKIWAMDLTPLSAAPRATPAVAVSVVLVAAFASLIVR